jgi:hypothetical protein
MTGFSADILDIVHSEVDEKIAQLKERLASGMPDQGDPGAGIRELHGVAVIMELHALMPLLDEIEIFLEVAPGEALADGHELADALAAISRLFDVLEDLDKLPLFTFIPEIGDLRKKRGKPPVYEYQLLGEHPWPDAGRFRGSTELGEEGREKLRRLKQVYQLGLLDVLRGENAQKGAELIARVASNLRKILDSEAEKHYWSLLAMVATRMAAGELAISPIRARLLSAVERQLKALLEGGGSPYPLGLWRAFAVLLAMTPERDDADRELRSWVGAPLLDFTDRDIKRVRDRLFGEPAVVDSGTLGELSEGLGALHSLLEVIDSQGEISDEDSDRFAREVREVASLCEQLGFNQAARRFREHAAVIQGDEPGWQANSDFLKETAHSILYLECLLSRAREKTEPGADFLSRLDFKAVDEVVEENLAGSGVHAVWVECLDRLASAKDYLDDIANELAGPEVVPELYALFTDIKGAATVVGDSQVVDIAWRCRDFVSDSLFPADSQEPRGLATFADAVVGLEAHFENALKGDRSELPLAIADEYLATLGA